MITATPSSRDALVPSRVMDGAMKPMMIRGTQKVMSWPMMYWRVTTTFMTLSGNTSPQRMPTAMPKSRRKGRLSNSFFIFFSP